MSQHTPANWPQFLDLVDRMRSAQRAFFRSRKVEYLEESRRLEREVDAAVKALAHPETVTPSLFGGGDA